MAKNLKEQIKEMEMKNRTTPQAEPKVKVSFDSWFHLRKDKIASCHHREILMADFKARGLKDEAAMEEFDKALELYGIKL